MMMHPSWLKLQAYLLWQKERGLRLPPLAASLPLLAQDDQSSSRKVQASSEETLADEAQNLPPIQPLLFGAGSPAPKLLCLTPTPQKQKKIITGSGRDLLIKILQAMGLDLRHDIYLGGLWVDQYDGPLQEKEHYQEEIKTLVTKLKPKAIVSLGSLATYLCHDEKKPFLDLRNQWLSPSYLGGQCSLMPLWHPHDILTKPELKRETWQALQLVMQKLS